MFFHTYLEDNSCISLMGFLWEANLGRQCVSIWGWWWTQKPCSSHEDDCLLPVRRLTWKPPSLSWGACWLHHTNSTHCSHRLSSGWGEKFMASSMNTATVSPPFTLPNPSRAAPSSMSHGWLFKMAPGAAWTSTVWCCKNPGVPWGLSEHLNVVLTCGDLVKRGSVTGAVRVWGWDFLKRGLRRETYP